MAALFFALHNNPKAVVNSIVLDLVGFTVFAILRHWNRWPKWKELSRDSQRFDKIHRNVLVALLLATSVPYLFTGDMYLDSTLLLVVWLLDSLATAAANYWYNFYKAEE